jgi:hypothetical protein
MRFSKKMFSSSLVLGFLMLLGSVCVSCTRNNGDIGPWFGEWQILNIQTNGVDDSDYHQNVFWCFQNDLISMNWRAYEPAKLTRVQRWGSWSEDDGYLVLNFTYYDDEYPKSAGEAGEGIYVPYPLTHLRYGVISRLKIVSMKGSDLTLTYQPEGEDIVYTYILKKR